MTFFVTTPARAKASEIVTLRPASAPTLSNTAFDVAC